MLEEMITFFHLHFQRKCLIQIYLKSGEGETYEKSNMEIYTTICKIDNRQEFAVWLRKLKQGLCINLEG